MNNKKTDRSSTKDFLDAKLHLSLGQEICPFQ